MNGQKNRIISSREISIDELEQNRLNKINFLGITMLGTFLCFIATVNSSNDLWERILYGAVMVAGIITMGGNIVGIVKNSKELKDLKNQENNRTL